MGYENKTTARHHLHHRSELIHNFLYINIHKKLIILELILIKAKFFRESICFLSFIVMFSCVEIPVAG